MHVGAGSDNGSFWSARFLRRVLRSLRLGAPLLAALALASGCKKPDPSVTLTPSATQTLEQGQTVAVTAAVTNDSKNSGVFWTLVPPSGAGTLTNITTTGATYNAPATVPNATSVTLVAQSYANSAAGAAVTINLVSPPHAIVGTLTPGLVGAPYSATLTEIGGIGPYTWSLISSPAAADGLALGASAATTNTVSGIPLTAGAATLTVQVKDSIGLATSSTFNVVINSTVASSTCGVGSESQLAGHYAFLLQGFSGSGAGTPASIAGSFGTNGAGGITGGVEDVNSYASVQSNLAINAAASSYSVGSDGRGCLTLANSGGANTFRFALGGVISGTATTGRIIEFDDSTGAGQRGSGIIRLQDTTSFSQSKLQARYAFGVDGWDTPSGTRGHFAMAGSFSSDTSGNVTAGFTDSNNAGTLKSGLTGATGSIGVIDASTGRATGSYSPGGGLPTFNWAVYAISQNELLIQAINTDSTAPVASGRVVATGSAFTGTSLTGGYIVHVTGSSGGNGSVALLLLTINAGTVTAGTGTTYTAASGPQAQTISAATDAVAASGRATFPSGIAQPPIIYLSNAVDGISGFVVGTDSAASSGLLEFQPSQSYGASSVAGSYTFGTEDAGDNTVLHQAGAITISTVSNLSGTEDTSSASGLGPGVSVANTLVIGSNGVGTAGSSFVVTNGSRIFIVPEASGNPAQILIAEPR